MSLSSFEIRLELLKLAVQVLNDKHNHDKMAFENDYFSARELYSQQIHRGELGIKVPVYPIKTYPINTSSIVEMANNLNEFICNR